MSSRTRCCVKTVDINRVDVARTYTPSSSLLDEVKAAYAHDADAKLLIEFLSAPSDKACRNLRLTRRLLCTHYRLRRSVGNPSRWTSCLVFRAIPGTVQTARLFVDMVFKHHGMPNDFVSDRDPRFTARFWQEVFTLLGTQFSMSTADHPQTDGQTERVNRVLVDLHTADHPQTDGQTERVNCLLVDLLKSYAQSFHNWSDYLPMAEFAINNAAIPAATKDNVSVRGTDTEKIHAQAGPDAITPEVSVPGADIPKSHAQSGTDATTSGESVQGTDAD
ncbi:LOW QUALITY PROTEIN: reverse transcriptase [Phytophthora megakarya]|uniref:Reverse transcriptase n=1 Tax=Phytophthora megakarya TaxID=4795 RepID=A0A225V2M5_9STRA|nr:LOW QUALITY PROTEIN: reverse transcriptase [Phytophthora megakarya]